MCCGGIIYTSIKSIELMILVYQIIYGGEFERKPQKCGIN